MQSRDAVHILPLIGSIYHNGSSFVDMPSNRVQLLQHIILTPYSMHRHFIDHSPRRVLIHNPRGNLNRVEAYLLRPRSRVHFGGGGSMSYPSSEKQVPSTTFQKGNEYIRRWDQYEEPLFETQAGICVCMYIGIQRR